MERALKLLWGDWAPYWLACFAVAVSLPALLLGLQADDHGFTEFFQVQHGAPWGLFRLAGADVQKGIDVGALAWWTNPQLEILFLRPLSSLTHALEFWLYPTRPWLMLLTNALLYGFGVLLAGLTYRRIVSGRWVAGFSTFMFALSESHAVSVGWIAGRNTLLAFTCAIAALYTHVLARQDKRPWLTGLSTACAALALLSGETGLAALFFLVSYALAFESERRLRSIAPQLIVGLVWIVIYVASGSGSRGSSFYRDLSRPWEVLAQGLGDLPLWIIAAFGLPGVGGLNTLPMLGVRLACLPIAIAILWLLFPVLRRSAEARFFALVTALCMLPLFATIVSNRVLISASFGAFGWLACFAHGALVSDRKLERLAARLVVLHAAVAPVWFMFLLASTRPMELATQALLKQAADRPPEQMVLVNAPIELLSGYTMSAWSTWPEEQRPQAFHQLYAGASPLSVKRVDAQTLEVTAVQGWGATVLERIFCDPQHMPASGTTLVVHDMTIQVLESRADGMPQRVSFHFPTPLEAPERRWLVWRGKKPVRWAPPQIGGELQLLAEPLSTALPR